MLFYISSGLLLLLYLAAFIYVFRVRGRARARKRFFRGILSVLDSCTDEHACAKQIEMLYRRISERVPGMISRFRTAADLVEEFICVLDTLEKADFEKYIQFPPPREHRDRIIAIAALLRSEQPFGSLSSKAGSLLNSLKQAVETGNKDLGLTSLYQVRDELEVVESKIQEQATHIFASYAISAVGLVLTLFFGLVSFVQFTAAPERLPKDAFMMISHTSDSAVPSFNMLDGNATDGEDTPNGRAPK